MWPFFWVTLAVVLTGGAVYASNMLMRIIDDRADRAKREVLNELDGVEQRLARLEQQLLPSGEFEEGPLLREGTDDRVGDG